LESLKTEAIVLRIVPWSETSLIVTLWTREYGKIGAVAKGARRPKSPFESGIDLLANSSVVFLSKSGDNLDLLTEAKLLRRFRSGQQNLLCLYAGFYVAEFLLRMTEENFAIAELFDYSKATLESLDNLTIPSEVVLRFELHALRLLGHSPCLETCAGCSQELSITSSLMILFSPEAGGVLCNECVRGQRGLLRVHKETIHHLSRLQALEFDDPSSLAIIPKPFRREVRLIINRFCSAIQQRAFDLHPFLEGLGR
jgi:DNA repair protein RecO (recombination protein O)